MTLLVGLLVLKTVTFTTSMQNGLSLIGNMEDQAKRQLCSPNANGGGQKVWQ